MLALPHVLLIGAADRNVGKTTLAERVVRRLAPQGRVQAAKITTVREVGRCPRGGSGCGVCGSLAGPFRLDAEGCPGQGKDTQRLKAAGANPVFWLRVRAEAMAEGLAALFAALPAGVPTLIESNSARTAIDPGIFVVLRRAGSEVVKPACAAVLGHADAVWEFDGAGWDGDPADLRFADGRFLLHHPRATALILAGGESRRMGTDKARLDWDGRPLVRHIADALAPLCGRVLVAAGADPGRLADLGLELVADAVAGLGPLEGLRAGLAAAPGDLVFTTPCDVPRLDPHLVHRLLAGLRTAEAAVAVNPQGRREPLLAAYRRVPALAAATAALARGDRKAAAIFAGLRTAEVPMDGAAWYRNLNTPDDYRQAREARAC